jgi:hypothetical protein
MRDFGQVKRQKRNWDIKLQSSPVWESLVLVLETRLATLASECRCIFSLSFMEVNGSVSTPCMLVCVSIIRVSSVNMVDAGPPILGPIEPKKV